MYQAPAPQGNLLAAISSWLGDSIARRDHDEAKSLAAATRTMINQQQGLPGGVDPFAVQKFGTGQAQNTAIVDSNNRANSAEGRAGEMFGWQRDDRTQDQNFRNGMFGALQGQTSSNPLLGAAMAGGPSPAALDLITKIIGGDQANTTARGNFDYEQGVRQTNAMDQARFQAEQQLAENIQRATLAQQGGEADLAAKAKLAAEKEGKLSAGIKGYIDTGDISQLPPSALDTDMIQGARQGKLAQQQQQQEAEAARAIMQQREGSNPLQAFVAGNPADAQRGPQQTGNSPFSGEAALQAILELIGGGIQKIAPNIPTGR